jgi:hypothetical protein
MTEGEHLLTSDGEHLLTEEEFDRLIFVQGEEIRAKLSLAEFELACARQREALMATANRAAKVKQAVFGVVVSDRGLNPDEWWPDVDAGRLVPSASILGSSEIEADEPRPVLQSEDKLKRQRGAAVNIVLED